MEFSEMTDAELLKIRESCNRAINESDCFSVSDLCNLVNASAELITRGYRPGWTECEGVLSAGLVPPPPEAPGL